jgi:hypothetical protein
MLDQPLQEPISGQKVAALNWFEKCSVARQGDLGEYQQLDAAAVGD